MFNEDVLFKGRKVKTHSLSFLEMTADLDEPMLSPERSELMLRCKCSKRPIFLLYLNSTNKIGAWLVSLYNELFAVDR